MPAAYQSIQPSSQSHYLLGLCSLRIPRRWFLLFFFLLFPLWSGDFPPYRLFPAIDLGDASSVTVHLQRIVSGRLNNLIGNIHLHLPGLCLYAAYTLLTLVHLDSPWKPCCREFRASVLRLVQDLSR
ncbi:hypothetical protein BDW60DRAFT_131086 [Aspergillus nidulans var. acristatus]